MFEGFARKRITTSGAEIALVQGGRGAPLLPRKAWLFVAAHSQISDSLRANAQGQSG